MNSALFQVRTESQFEILKSDPGYNKLCGNIGKLVSLLAKQELEKTWSVTEPVENILKLLRVSKITPVDESKLQRDLVNALRRIISARETNYKVNGAIMFSRFVILQYLLYFYTFQFSQRQTYIIAN